MSWPRFVARNLRQRPGRAAVCVAAVAIGVTVFLAVSIGTRSLSTAVEDRVPSSFGPDTVELVPVGVFDGVAPASAVEAVRRLPDVAYAAGAYNVRATIEAGTGNALVPAGLLSAAAFPQMRGRPPAAGAEEIAIGPTVAEQLAVEPGAIVRVRTAGALHDALVTGIVMGQDGGSAYALIPRDVLLRWTGSGDVVNHVIVGLQPSVGSDAWIAAHRGDLGGLQPASSVSRDDAVKFFRTIDDTLAPLAASSLFVAGYLIFLTMARAVQDRQSTTATLRALGTSPLQLVGLLLGEAAIIGVAGTLLGLVLGSVLGRGVTSVLRELFDLTIAGDASASVPWSVISVALVLGLLTPLVAALLPALRAARSDPARHLRGEVAMEPTLSIVRLAIGSALFVVGTAATLKASPQTRALTLVLALIGTVVAVPVATRPIGAILAHVWSRLRPGPGELAAQEMARRPARSAQTAALLVSTLIGTFLVATLNASQRPDFIRILDNHYGADLDAYPVDDEPVPPATLAAVNADPAVAGVSPGARGTVAMLDPRGRSEPLTVIDLDTYFEVAGLPWIDGTDVDAAITGLRTGEVAVASAIAARLEVHTGDEVTLQTVRGPAKHRVAGVFHGLGWGETVSVAIGTALAAESFGLRGPSVLHVDLRPGTSPSTWGATHPDLFVSPTGGIRAGILSQFDGVTNIAVVLLVITVLVGVLGLANTLAMDVLDRQREIGVLRALGTQRREVRAMILAQSLILTSVAGVLAVMLGTILGAASVVGTKTDGLGLPVSFHYPVRAVPLILGAALLVGGLAAITPARMASRMEPADAVRLPAEA